MQSYLHAYEAYEKRTAREEITTRRMPRQHRPIPLLVVLEANLGDLMVRLGLSLKKHASAGKSMAWSPMTGSKE